LNKPIIEKGYINFNNLLYFVKSNAKSSIIYSFYAIILFSVYFFVKTPSYSSKITFYTNYNNANQSFLLSPFLGDIAGLDDSGLNFSVSEYLDSERFLKHIVEKKYKINEKNISLVEHWGTHYNNYLTINPMSLIKTLNRNIMFNKNYSIEDKRLSFAKEVFSGKIFHSENRKSGLNTVTVVVKKYPNLSKQINEEVYLAILDYTNQINNVKANEKITFIKARLDEVKSSLSESEIKMLDFVVENKNYESSPILSLEQSRIQREINSHNQLYLSLLDQYELAKIDSKDNTHSIFYLDKEILNSSKEGISLIKGIVFIFVGTFIIMLFHKLYIHRLKLFYDA
jgi:uncharacterized protein involved in exopolysaccharide biosynthesis